VGALSCQQLLVDLVMWFQIEEVQEVIYVFLGPLIVEGEVVGVDLS
jgi:hypothetical protein